MFSRKQNMQGYYIQQNRMDHLNMGNPYYPVTPYPNYPPPYPRPVYQHQMPVPNQFQPYPNNGWNLQQQPPYQNYYSTPPTGVKSNVQSIFHNPLEPKEPFQSQMQMPNNPMYYNPYPKPNMIPKPNGGIGTIMNSFKGQDGNIDINKMMNTAGQMMNAVSQVSSMVKGLGGFFKV
jgi:hypothetical protein